MKDSTPVYTETKEQSEIRSALTIQDETISILLSAVENIEKRFGFVLLEKTPPDTSDEKKKEIYTELAREIDSNNQRIDSIIYYLNSILARCEL